MAEYRRKRVRNRKANIIDVVSAIFNRLSRRAKLIMIAAAVVVIALVIIISLPKGDLGEVGSIDMPVPTETYTETTPTLTPVPTTAPTVTPDPTLKMGDENEDVQQLQERLMELGYLDIDESTQKFGPATEQAVKWFQRQEGLEQTGIADGEMQAWLYADDAKHYALLEGTEGTDVDSLQRQLNRLGYLSKVTGYYGTDTVKAVKAFQKRNKLTQDGKTGENTLDKIYSPNAVPTPEKQADLRGIRNINEVIEAANDAIGKPYVSGREGPSSFDCSGLVYWCLHQAGSNRGRYNAQGYSVVSDWEVVCEGKMNFSKLNKGDLLFFKVPGRDKAIGHVAIYIGNRTVIDASSSSGKVVKRRCDGPWFTSNFRLARRPYGSA